MLMCVELGFGVERGLLASKLATLPLAWDTAPQGIREAPMLALRHTAPPTGVRSGRRGAAAAVQARGTAKQFVEQLSTVPGNIRFIAIGEGAILESVSKYSAVKYMDLGPGKGELATWRWVTPSQAML